MLSHINTKQNLMQGLVSPAVSRSEEENGNKMLDVDFKIGCIQLVLLLSGRACLIISLLSG